MLQNIWPKVNNRTQTILLRYEAKPVNSKEGCDKLAPRERVKWPMNNLGVIKSLAPMALMHSGEGKPSKMAMQECWRAASWISHNIPFQNVTPWLLQI